MNKKFVIERSVSFPGNVYLVDGLTGTGKTLVTKLFSTAINSDIPQFDYQLEQICILNKFKKIDDESTKVLIKLMVDQKRYDNSISREVNFRLSDLSSSLNSDKRFQYLNRLFLEDGAVAEKKLFNSPRNLIFITHQLLEAASIISHSLRNKFYHVICTRHPIYLFHHWRSYIELFGNSPRDFTVWREYKNFEIPWFVESEHLWFTGNSDEKSIIAISDLTNKLLKYKKICKDRHQTVFLEFEKLVLGKLNILQSFEDLDLKLSRHISKVLKKEKVPRNHLNEGTNRKIYRRYAADKLNSHLDHKSDYNKLKSDIFKMVRTKYQKRIEESIEHYEQTFSLWFEK